MLAGLGAGVLVAVLAFAFRRSAPTWAGGGRLAVLIVVAVLLGAATAVLLRPPGTHRAGPEDEALTRVAVRLKSADQRERLAAIRELARLTQYEVARLPAITAVVAEFVRDRAPRATAPACATSVPADDVAAALDLLRARPSGYDANAVIDLRATCLAGTDLRSLRLLDGTLADANLTGANLRSADLTGRTWPARTSRGRPSPARTSSTRGSSTSGSRAPTSAAPASPTTRCGRRSTRTR